MRSLKSKEIVKCSECDKSLIELIITTDIEYEVKLVVECPYCSGKSFAKKLNNHHKFCPSYPLYIKSVDIDLNAETEKIKYGRCTENNTLELNTKTVKLGRP